MIFIICCNFGSWFSDSLIVRDWFCRENDLIRPPQRRNEPLVPGVKLAPKFMQKRRVILCNKGVRGKRRGFWFIQGKGQGEMML